MGVTISGTFSGLDVSAIISTLIAPDSVPMTKLQTTDTSLESQTFPINGTPITPSDSDTLQSVLDRINSSVAGETLYLP